jgi:hypothetical protein
MLARRQVYKPGQKLARLNNMKKLFFVIVSICLSFLLATRLGQAATYQYDLSVNGSDIRFNPSKIIAGKKTRIYIKVRNIGQEDMRGKINFFRGATDLGNSQGFSVVPGSYADAFIDFIVPNTAFNIEIRLSDSEPTDDNFENNTTQTNLITPLIDSDNDGLTDDEDPDDDNDGLIDSKENESVCPFRLKADSDNDGYLDGVDVFPCDNKEWQDTDGDGIGDNADTDIDNDGLSNEQEKKINTNPFKSDTDGDGVNDNKDAFPLDPSKSKAVSRDLFNPVNKTSPNKTDDALAGQQIKAVIQESDDQASSTEINAPTIVRANSGNNIVSNIKKNDKKNPPASLIVISFSLLLIIYIGFKFIKRKPAVENKNNQIIDLAKIKKNKIK